MNFFVYMGVHDLNIYKKNKAGVKKKIKNIPDPGCFFMISYSGRG
jgi:hypothetical protein